MTMFLTCRRGRRRPTAALLRVSSFIQYVCAMDTPLINAYDSSVGYIPSSSNSGFVVTAAVRVERCRTHHSEAATLGGELFPLIYLFQRNLLTCLHPLKTVPRRPTKPDRPLLDSWSLSGTAITLSARFCELVLFFIYIPATIFINIQRPLLEYLTSSYHDAPLATSTVRESNHQLRHSWRWVSFLSHISAHIRLFLQRNGVFPIISFLSE
jgi:hypothetical protein